MALAQLAQHLASGASLDLLQSTNETIIYPRSLHEYEGIKVMMIRQGIVKYLIAVGQGSLYDELQGTEWDGYKVCPTDHGNRLVLNRYFPHTIPQAFGKHGATFGLEIVLV